MLVSNLNIANAGGGTRHIGIWGSEGPANVVVRGASFWGDLNRALHWQSSGLVSISDSIVSWNKSKKLPAVQIDRGRAMIQHNYFTDSGGTAVAVAVGPDTDRVMIVGNELAGNRMDLHGPLTLEATNHA